ncbi:putative protease YdeA [Methanosarcinaceae archaeon Ag5]|uniref:Protease YdeA n=1 Tax=Methanolapillus africanus TaxID=3028297 RepID=A0AAE4SDT8_9EURY|nr:putative protease YdeA [Methanosarcinaceae archaeon Ag5]
MKEKVLFVILDQYADWEYSFLATALQGGFKGKTSPYDVKTVSLNRDPVKSIGNFTTLPDYGIDEMPSDYAGLILVGGNSWRTPDAKKVAPSVVKAYEDGKVVGAICDATVFLGMNGLLNDKKHTSNMLGDLTAAAQENYTGGDHYLNEPAVRDGHLVTANGTGYLEFARETLLALKAYSPDDIEENYQFFKLGYIDFLKKMNL